MSTDIWSTDKIHIRGGVNFVKFLNLNGRIYLIVKLNQRQHFAMQLGNNSIMIKTYTMRCTLFEIILAFLVLFRCKYSWHPNKKKIFSYTQKLFERRDLKDCIIKANLKLTVLHPDIINVKEYGTNVGTEPTFSVTYLLINRILDEKIGLLIVHLPTTQHPFLYH